MTTKKTKTAKQAITAKKSTAARKKATSKKTPTRTQAKGTKKANPELVVAAPEQAFWVNSGSTLHSLLELADELAAIENEVFSHHVTADRHDFADWVEQVLADTSCAAALRKAKLPKRAHTVVVTHLKRYRI